MFQRNVLPWSAGWLIMGHMDEEVIGKKGNYQFYEKFGLPGTTTKNSWIF
jgi:hypothetical protein